MSAHLVLSVESNSDGVFGVLVDTRSVVVECDIVSSHE